VSLALFSPDVPGAPGGVSDHTLALARALAGRGASVSVLAGRGDPALFVPIPCRLGVGPGPHGGRDLADALAEADADCVLVQYVPFLYARLGVAPRLVEALRRVRRAGIRVAVFVHEPFVPYTRLPWLLTGGPQRLQLRAILRLAERAYAPVPAWVARLSVWNGGRVPVTLAPVGATLPVSTLSREAARARLGLQGGEVAIGVFSPGANAFRDDWVLEAWRAAEITPAVRWVLFGNGSAALGERMAGPSVTALGTLPPAGIADVMRAMDLALAPYRDGLTLRRTAAMLALAHGVATVSSTGHLWDPALGALALCPDTASAFAAEVARLSRDAAARAALGAAGLEGYRRMASVEALADLLIRDLHLEGKAA
jgi:glycosyltransferase involved in cell wall biosynthesis